MWVWVLVCLVCQSCQGWILNGWMDGWIFHRTPGVPCSSLHLFVCDCAELMGQCMSVLDVSKVRYHKLDADDARGTHASNWSDIFKITVFGPCWDQQLSGKHLNNQSCLTVLGEIKQNLERVTKLQRFVSWASSLQHIGFLCTVFHLLSYNAAPWAFSELASWLLKK